DLTELELMAQWCRKQIEHRRDARLLLVLPGSAGARERLATLIEQAIDPAGWLDRHGVRSAVTIEGGSPLARHPAIAHALSTLKWLGGEQGDFESITQWLRSTYWSMPDAGVRARIDLWLRRRPRMQLNLSGLAAELRSSSGAVSSAAPQGANLVIAQ